MPYVPEPFRGAAKTSPVAVGELTFAIQQLVKGYVALKGESYQTYAECLGALRGAELDLWDRKIQPYERAKCETNGDVW